MRAPPRVPPRALAQESFGPLHESDRYRSRFAFGEDRFTVDLGRDPEYVGKRLGELVTTGFVDPLQTRVARIRLLAYNDALAMLVAVTIQTELSPTGVLTHSQSGQSMPAQEYMPHSMLSQLLIEGILVIWTLGQVRLSPLAFSPPPSHLSPSHLHYLMSRRVS